MCGACGSGRVAPAWEERLAGAGPAQRSARAAAAGRLLAGRRLRVAPWRGGYLLTAATGAARPVASLDQLWAAAGEATTAVGVPAGTRPEWALADLPTGWDVQAAVVWISAAAQAGLVTEAALPAGGSTETAVAGGRVRFSAGGTGTALPSSQGPAGLGLHGPDAATSLDALMTFARSARHADLTTMPPHGHTLRP